ncbi:Histone acetyltransferase, partial [Nymphaea thermarum]
VNFLRRKPHATEVGPKLPDVARRLELGLFKSASSKEEYMDTSTLQRRLANFMSRISASNHSQQLRLRHYNSSSSSIGAMIPTPGMPQSGNANPSVSSVGNSMVASSSSASLVTSSASTANLLSTNGSVGGMQRNSFNSSNGLLSNGYQQSLPNTSMDPRSNMLSSLGTPRHSTQMMPTPGLSDSRSLPMNPSTGGGFSGVESVVASQPQQPRQYASSQNNRMMHSIGGQMGIGMRSSLQPKPSGYVFPNGVLNGGLGNNVPLMNGMQHSEGYLNSSAYVNTQKPLQQHMDQQPQQQIMQNGDGYAVNNADISGSGNLYGSERNSQNVNPLGLQSNLKSNSGLQSRQPNFQSFQQTPNVKPQSIDHSEKMNMPTSHSNQHHALQPQQQIQRVQPQQFSNHPHQSNVQFVQHQHQHQKKEQNAQQHDSLRHPQFLGNAQLASTAVGQLLPGQEVELHDESLHHPLPDQYQFSELQNQYNPGSLAQDLPNGSRILIQSSSSQELHSSFSQASHQFQQIMQPQQPVPQAQNHFAGLTVGRSEVPVTEEWQAAREVKSPGVNQFSAEQRMQEDSRRVMQPNGAQRPHLTAQRTVNGKIVSSENYAGPPGSTVTLCRPGGKTLRSRQKEIIDQQRWLLFLRHARNCSAEGKCPQKHCVTAQNLCRHMDKCHDIHCNYTYCYTTKKLMNHFNSCRSAACALCVPVRRWISRQKACATQPLDAMEPNSTNGVLKTPLVDASTTKMTPKNISSASETSDDLQPSLKRVKLENSAPSFVMPRGGLVHDNTSVVEGLDEKPHGTQHPEALIPTRSDVVDVKLESPMSSVCGTGDKIIEAENNKNGIDNSVMIKPEVEPQISNDSVNDFKQEVVPARNEIDQVKQDMKLDSSGSTADHTAGNKSGKPKIKGVSLTELFTPEQVREHIVSLRQWVGQSKAKAEKNQAMEHSMSENSCQLCAVEKLTFEPPPIYCTSCGARIKRNAMYYTFGSADTRHYFCIPCYNEARGENIEVDGMTILKARMEKKKNDEETEEWWVQCDKCEAWQHQICALFNGRRNDGGQAEYTCPNCHIAEIERGERKPLPQSAVLGAKDLPRTILSDQIEQRLFRKLKQEKQDRARAQGKSFDEVLGADGLVVRVVSSVDKKLEVKPRFLEIFQEDNYPSEFPYKSKVVLLFQKIEGVEVCLFSMYVQEFGSECQQPNQRRVYLSYLDSVKYFRPEVKTVTGEALRTFVYHEILIGYLEYCKKRGFTSCYIWACPPLKGEDYILYCHPEIQKTPKSDKLREWYLSMLRKATREDIVVDLTNLYDHFFVTNGECKAKVTAARLPYFDGDYWPGAAEDMINQLRQEEDGKNQQKKGKTKKTITKRALKAAAQADLSSNASKDALLMQKLGETICPMKEDFIMVHLQHTCSHCCRLMVSGKRWVCSRQCKNFQLCDKCYEAEQKLEERARHPVNSRDKHILFPVEVTDVPVDTKDKDEILESEFFDTRQAFLSLCQGNHYQYDTLRRAKHSSMMVLYHLHNPTAPAFVTTCNVCHHDIEAGQGWRCEVCPDFDVCNACYQKDGGIDHPHKLTNPPSTADRDAQNKEARQKRVLQLRKMLDLLVHASQCRSGNCQYPNCRKVKGLFRHGSLCKVRASGGCQLCKKMWHILQLHARACKESECNVPRCRDLKEHLRRLQQQSESRRRAAVMEMMRQRAAEVAGNTV